MEYQFFLIALLVLFCRNSFTDASESEGKDAGKPAYQPQTKFPFGDYRNCVSNGISVPRLETLPGLGWDNLRNRISGMVVFFNYSQCRTTADGQYLIPDDVFITPIKESKGALFSELIDHWSNYSSMTSTTVNVEAHESFFGSISGSFSSEYSDVKKHQLVQTPTITTKDDCGTTTFENSFQVEDKTVTARTTLRYRMYAAHLQPDAQLHPKFKTRLLDIGAHLQNKNMHVARFLSDLLVRDYGTHYTTRIDSGGILAKMDQLLKSYVGSSETTRSQTKASASASFFGTFGVSGSVSHLNKHTVSDTYTKNVMDSKIYTFGGPPVRENFTLKYWEDNLGNNQVAIDREGDPLHFIITTEALPELPEEITFKISAMVLKSLQRYYKNNAITGCTDAESPNFNFQANLDDHSCKALQTNFTFGGVYQTCTPTGSPPTDPCVDYTQKNPKTQGYSCPNGYTAIRLHQGTLATHCQTTCHGWWIFRSCDTNCGGGVYTTFWCAAESSVPQDSGYLFGGIYSETVKNVITKAKKCPNKFYPQRFGPKHMYVCISDDYELGAQYSIPFGGFMSCSAGNPLAMTSRKGLAMSVMGSGPSAMPKHCPLGFSQHLAVIDEDCEINYCTKTNFLSQQGLPVIKRPPFHRKPSRNDAIMFPLMIENNDTDKVYIRRGKDDGHWIELTARMSMEMPLRKLEPTQGAVGNLKLKMEALEEITGAQSAGDSKGDSSNGLSGGATAGIVIGAIVGAVLLAIALFALRRRRNTSLNDDHSGYRTFQNS